MTEVTDLIQYKKDRVLKAALITQMNTKMTKDEADYTVLQLLEIFCRKRYPDIFWEFDLFINGKLE